MLCQKGVLCFESPDICSAKCTSMKIHTRPAALENLRDAPFLKSDFVLRSKFLVDLSMDTFRAAEKSYPRRSTCSGIFWGISNQVQSFVNQYSNLLHDKIGLNLKFERFSTGEYFRPISCDTQYKRSYRKLSL